MSGRVVARLLRLLALVVAALVVTEALRRLVTPPLGALVGAVTQGRSWDHLPLEVPLAGCCAAALSLAWTWLLLCGALVAVDALHRCGAAGPGPVPACPRWVRTLVLAALGLAVSTGPALADDRGPAPAPADLVGLTLPDRTATPVTVARRLWVTVRPGDTLWAIAARQLFPTAPDRVVDRAWRRVAAANHGRVGDPDLIFPGTVLRVPDLDRPTRKEAP